MSITKGITNGKFRQYFLDSSGTVHFLIALLITIFYRQNHRRIEKSSVLFGIFWKISIKLPTKDSPTKHFRRWINVSLIVQILTVNSASKYKDCGSNDRRKPIRVTNSVLMLARWWIISLKLDMERHESKVIINHESCPSIYSVNLCSPKTNVCKTNSVSLKHPSSIDFRVSTRPNMPTPSDMGLVEITWIDRNWDGVHTPETGCYTLMHYFLVESDYLSLIMRTKMIMH
jgi:hypothetical protein